MCSVSNPSAAGDDLKKYADEIKDLVSEIGSDFQRSSWKASTYAERDHRLLVRYVLLLKDIQRAQVSLSFAVISALAVLWSSDSGADLWVFVTVGAAGFAAFSLKAFWRFMQITNSTRSQK